ncbi:MAG: zinc-binding dehydrogenase [Elusimicrobia bacterium]|nr:zinc-binding dehydrogenase [Elusimicrobiota bacterium]
MRTPAAVLVEPGKPLALAELEIPALKPGQVLVEVAFSGVCRTQLLETRGEKGPDAHLPHALGHEGSGTVREAGPGVSKVKPGQDVVLTWMKGSGAEAGGAVYRWGSRTVNAGAMTTFQRLAVVSESRLVALPPGLPAAAASLMGCALPTGFGMIFNVLRLAPGQSVAVFGAGGVGLCAAAAARCAGAGVTVVVDPRADRRAAALALGATRALAPGPGLADELRALAPEGFDAAVEASGRTEAMAAALACVRPRGGSAVVAGNARFGEMLAVDPRELNAGKRLLGTWGGDNEPDRDFPRWAGLIAEHGLDLAPLLGAAYPLARVNEALADLESGRVLRPLLDLSLA